jgi:hypothetical protein
MGGLPLLLPRIMKRSQKVRNTGWQTRTRRAVHPPVYVVLPYELWPTGLEGPFGTEATVRSAERYPACFAAGGAPAHIRISQLETQPISGSYAPARSGRRDDSGDARKTI